MKKFSGNNLSYNPYNSNDIRSKIYKLVNENLYSNKGKVVGIEEFTEKFYEKIENDVKEKYLDILEQKRKGIQDQVDDIDKDGFSEEINSMNDEDDDIVHDRTDDFSTNYEPLSESLKQNITKKLK